MPLIGSLIRILQYMEGCGKRSVDNSKESEQEETGKGDLNEEDFHLKILKDICCELLSNMFQELTKVRINKVLRGISVGWVRKKKLLFIGRFSEQLKLHVGNSLWN